MNLALKKSVYAGKNAKYDSDTLHKIVDGKFNNQAVLHLQDKLFLLIDLGDHVNITSVHTHGITGTAGKF